MATPSTIRCELVWQHTGLDWAVNVLHYTTGAAGPLLGDDVSAMASAIDAAFVASLLPADYANEVSLDRIRVRDIRTDGNEVIERDINRPGSNVGNTLPLQTAVVSTIRSTFVTRRGRGRIYWPAPAVGNMAVSGTLVPATAGRYSSFVTDLMQIAAGGQGNLTLAVLSRVDNVARSVVSVSTNDGFDVQVRRRDLSIS